MRRVALAVLLGALPLAAAHAQIALPAVAIRTAADGAQNRPGRTKANSSRASNTRFDRGGTGTPNRRAVIADVGGFHASTDVCNPAGRPPRPGGPDHSQ